MKYATTRVPAVTIGLDLGNKHSQLCQLDADGQVVREVRIASTKAGITKALRGVQCSRIAIETGTHSPWISRLLKELGHEVIVANSRTLALITQNGSKSDKLDALRLAQVARMDIGLLSPVTHRSGATQADMALLKSRDILVGCRTKLINHVRGLVKTFGVSLPAISSPAFARRASTLIPEVLRDGLGPILEEIEALNARIKAYDVKAESLCEQRYPVTKHLRQISGVGSLTALAFVLAIEDPKRFRKSRNVSAFLGLCPRQHSSGESNPQMRISKRGNEYMRRLLVSAAHYILGPFGPPTDLREWGLKLAGGDKKNKTAKKRAVVAVARKLAVMLHRLWVTGEVYQPQGYQSKRHKRCA